MKDCSGRVFNGPFRSGAARMLLLILCICTLIVGGQEAGPHETPNILVQQSFSGTQAFQPADGTDRFTLRHVFQHGTHKHPGLHRKKDIRPDNHLSINAETFHGKESSQKSLVARNQPIDIIRLRDRRPATIATMLAAARQHAHATSPSMSAWTIDNLLGPNITDKETVLSLAKMSNNAYAENETESGWEDLSSPFNRSLDFGFDGDGLQGHVYANENNSTIVIGIKGTSIWVYDGHGTSTNDKINDNLFGSCCCGQQGQWMWRQVCDCATSTFTCNNTCVVQALREENRYYSAATDIFTNATIMYPNSNVWLVGHSLGGSVSSLLGLTYGVPAVTFEAVPDALAAVRLGLPAPPDSLLGAPQTRQLTGAFHFGHTADPVYMGVCNGATSSCSMAGYAFESQCHTGARCVYDVVGDKGWRVSINTHRIRIVIDSVISQYDEVPKCAPEPECQDCFNWKYFESNHTDETTTSRSSTSSKTRTRTETCKTPGWWGCLDETTTTTTTTTTTSLKSTITTTTTTTCKTPGWFGCNDGPSTTRAASVARDTLVYKTFQPTPSSTPP